MKGFLERIIGSYSDRELKRIRPIVEQINALEDTFRALSDEELKGKTSEFRARYANGESLDSMLPEAFATVREAAWRVLSMRHFDVQLIGGIVLHQGRIAEMKTGEGKTLVATLPAYLNAITGKGVHIVTVNDYLAKRDSEWMGKVYQFLGLTVGLIIHDKDPKDRKKEYAADITYGTNNEFGFDYLRDNMVVYKEQKVQRGHAFAIVDEVDSILIDEARTPLIISGQGDKSTALYDLANNFAKGLRYTKVQESDDKSVEEEDANADYIVDEKANTAALTAKGVQKAEAYFKVENLSDPENATISHHINQAIRAHGIMRRDKDYVVKDGEIIIVDEFTGRLMMGRRYSDGLHQAIEAKEGVKVERESKTLATITFQNYFRLYGKLSGMTGTALTEEAEFQSIYKLDVIVIPTNKPLAREDLADAVYKTVKGKLNAVVKQILDCHAKGQPVLVGTVSIEKSEELSALLKKHGVRHSVLNAKFHEKEAEIVAQAGRLGAVTIATNMAGRGTDIVLGGNAEFMAKEEMRKQGYSDELLAECTGHADTDNEEILEARETFARLEKKHKEQTDAEHQQVLDAGGLYIIGTERHDSRRIDNQLCGRAGRQGDKGNSKFFLSLEDDLMRLFGGEWISRLTGSAFSEEDALEMGMLTGAIETAQKKVEGKNFDIRKNVLRYDDVMNEQRKLIYAQRDEVLEGGDFRERIFGMFSAVADEIVLEVSGEHQFADEWDWSILDNRMMDYYRISLPLTEEQRLSFTREELKEAIVDAYTAEYEKKEEQFGDNMREIERIMLLRVVDQKWMDHIDAMDQLRHGIGLRAYAQRDPIIEYKFEGMDMFEEMVAAIKRDTTRFLFRVALQSPAPQREQVAKPTVASAGGDGSEIKKTPVRKGEKVGRNDPCPCGSGKKYKKCCGA